jgi:hypothetical protein
VVLDLPLVLVASTFAAESTLPHILYYGLPSVVLGLAVFWVVFSTAPVSLRESQRTGA